MDKAMQHWKILQRLKSELVNKVREFMVIGEKGDGVIVVSEDGQGFWFGKIKFGEFETKTVVKPTPLEVSGLVQMAQSNSHILLLNKMGEIYSMEANNREEQELGTVDEETRLLPRIIRSTQKFTSVRCGESHSLALTEDGNVCAWGSNNYCQLGVPSKAVQNGVPSSNSYLSSPYQISELNPSRVVAIECGNDHSLALTDNGVVYAWGANRWGQLGYESGSSKRTLAPNPIPNPIAQTTNCPVKSIAAGYKHTLVLTESGEVWACGWNNWGQLSLPITTEFSVSLVKVAGLPPISQIAAHRATHLSIAITSDQRCFVWGQLTIGKPISTPWELPSFYSTVESPFSFFSSHRSTPHSVPVPASECSDSEPDSNSGSPESEPKSVSGETQSSTYQILDQMFDNSYSNPDVQFQVGEETILAHRSVLQISSAHFRQLFSSSLEHSNQSDSNSSISTPQSDLNELSQTTDSNHLAPTTPHCPQVTISIPDHSYPTFYAYLSFLYLGILEVAPEHLADLFSLSVDYLDSKLQQLCLVRMRTTIIPSTCCLYYQLTHRHSQLPELEDFRKELVQFISTRTSEIYRTDAYRSMDSNLCKTLSIAITELQSQN